MTTQYKGSIDGSQKRLEPVLVGNSETVVVGELMASYGNAGALVRATAATPVLGFLHSISEGDVPQVQGTHTAGSENRSDLNTVAAAADNETTRRYVGWVDTNPMSIYSITVSGTLGTTAGSPTQTRVRGGWIDIDSANSDWDQVLEGTHTRTVATTANLVVHGVDPDDTTRLLVSITSSELQKDQNTEA